MAFRFREVTEAEEARMQRPSELFKAEVQNMHETFDSSYYNMTALLNTQQRDLRYAQEQMEEMFKMMREGQMPSQKQMEELQETMDFLSDINRKGWKIMEEHDSKFTEHAKNVENMMKENRKSINRFGDREDNTPAKNTKSSEQLNAEMIAELEAEGPVLEEFEEESTIDTMTSKEYHEHVETMKGLYPAPEPRENAPKVPEMDTMTKEEYHEHVQMMQRRELENEGPVAVTPTHGLTPPSEDMMQQLNAISDKVQLENMEHGYSLKVYFENGYHLDVEKTTHTPGQEWEIAVARGKDFVYDTPITDDKISFATESDIVDAAKSTKELPNPERSLEMKKMPEMESFKQASQTISSFVNKTPQFGDER